MLPPPKESPGYVTAAAVSVLGRPSDECFLCLVDAQIQRRHVNEIDPVSILSVISDLCCVTQREPEKIECQKKWRMAL